MRQSMRAQAIAAVLRLAPPEPLHWNPHVERLREAGFPRPWAMYETLIREPDALGRSVTRLVDLCIEAMERARQNVEDAREAARKAELEIAHPPDCVLCLRTDDIAAHDHQLNAARQWFDAEVLGVAMSEATSGDAPWVRRVDPMRMRPLANPAANALRDLCAVSTGKGRSSKRGQRAAERKAKGWR